MKLIPVLLMTTAFVSSTVVAQTSKPSSTPSVEAQPIEFERQTLDNGLQVIYAPMHNAPVVHVRVLYHVGSRDEAADRQGFAHMFEHMMFRGSEHVASELHMKLIQGVGGISNAFTSFDQTTYHETIPNTQLKLALWLEADRMASFKVKDNVLATERNVVKEEWRLRYANQPFGSLSQDLFNLAFTTHNYKWLPIGDMDQLAEAQPPELQDFHDRYYVPNNACLIIAGEFDVAQAKAWVKDYFGWIKPGPQIDRVSKPEPQQIDGPRSLVVSKPNLPFTRVMLCYKTPSYRDDDQLALNLLTSILGDGRSSRLYQSMVANDPIASGVSLGNYQLEDPSIAVGSFAVLPGKNPDEAVARYRETVNKLVADGPTQEELDKARVQARVSLVQARADAESVGTLLGEEQVFGGDANRANEYFAMLDKLTVADLTRVARTYLTDQALTVVQYRPGARTAAANDAAAPVESAAQSAAATQPATSMPTIAPASKPSATMDEIAAAQPIPPAAKRARLAPEFPSDYPKEPPLSDAAVKAEFAKGQSQTIRGVQVITMTDNRLPVVSVRLVIRGGSDAAPADKEGVAGLANAMLTRGAGGKSAAELATESESRAVEFEFGDDNDVTRVGTFATVDQLDFAVDRLKLLMTQPDFPAGEFAKLKAQALQSLRGRLSDPGEVADQKLDATIYSDASPLGRSATPESVESITLDDVKAYYQATYKPADAILVFSGAIDPARATALANKLLEGWADGAPPKATYPEPPSGRQILLVDNPDGQQAVVRMGIKGYTLASEDRFAGSVLGQVLSTGIDSRLNKVLRAEKGLTYGAYGYFRPTRTGGAFELSIETKPESVDDAITSTFGVLDELKKSPITDAELNEAKRRTAGLMVLETQTIQDLAKRRTDTILNGYPVDYYDHYAERIARVKADEVQAVAKKYLDDGAMQIVVVGPAELKKQLDKFGDVKVVPMPLDVATSQPASQPAK